MTFSNSNARCGPSASRPCHADWAFWNSARSWARRSMTSLITSGRSPGSTPVTRYIDRTTLRADGVRSPVRSFWASIRSYAGPLIRTAATVPRAIQPERASAATATAPSNTRRPWMDRTKANTDNPRRRAARLTWLRDAERLRVEDAAEGEGEEEAVGQLVRPADQVPGGS